MTMQRRGKAQYHIISGQIVQRIVSGNLAVRDASLRN